MALRIAIEARAAAEVPAGRGRFVRELLRHLVQLPGDFELVLHARRPWPFSDPLGRARWALVGGRERPWPLRAGRAAGRGADVVLATTSYLFALASAAPSVAVVHDLIPFHPELHPPRGSGLERISLPLATRRARSFVAISSATADELQARFPATAGRVRVAPLGVGREFTPEPEPGDAAARARHGLQEPYVLVTGTLEPRKNLPRVIDAFATLGPGRREVLAMAGAPGWQTAEILRGVAALGSRARLLGYVPDGDLPALYRGAAAFCYASLYEGFGLPVGEALACGAPTVTSRSSSLPEVGGEAAFYVDPEDTDDIRRGLADALGDGDEARRRTGILHASRFDWRSTAEIVLDELRAAGG